MCKNLVQSDFLLIKPTKSSLGLKFFILKARLAFVQLRQTFIKVLIFYHPSPKCNIWFKTNASSYTIGEILSQLILNNLGQLHLVVFFFQKMI